MQVYKDPKSPFLMSGCKVADGYGIMLVRCFTELLQLIYNNKLYFVCMFFYFFCYETVCNINAIVLITLKLLASCFHAILE